MSKFARIVAPVAMLAVMSMGGVAHAQDSGTSSGATTPGATPGSTTTTIPPRPKAIPVTVSWGVGRPGQTIKVSADVRGCSQPGSARGEFRDRMGAVRPLLDQLVTGSSRFTALLVVNERDATGWGKFRVVCDAGLPTATQGYASFWVAPKPGPVVVTVTPTSGGPGTVVKVIATVTGGCDPLYTFFQDSKNSKDKGGVDKGPDILSFNEPRMVGRYTITSKDAVGRARFVVSCDARSDTYRTGSANFWVRGAGTGKPSSGGSPSGSVEANRGKGTVQLPNAIDTGLGGAADGDGQDRGDPVRWLPPAWVLLVLAAAGIHIYQAVRRRRQ
jgi:hypothetical protein